MPGRLPADRLAQNLAALKKAQPEYWEWLNAADSQNLVELTQALDGAPILIVDGQSQDSRRTPEDRAWATLKSQLAAAEGPGDLGPGPGEGLRPKEAEAKATIEDPGPLAGQSRAQRAALGRPLWLFGLGSPLALWRLLRETSAAAGPVNLYEPRAAVALKGLSALDFSAAIAEGNLVFWAPQDLIDRAPTPKSLLLFHPPSARGQKSQFERLSAFLTGRDRRALPKGRAPKILIAGPLSGGPESMGPALLRAGLALNYPTELLRWSDEARDLAGQAQKGDPAAARGLLALAALEAKRALAAFKPDLTVALAQAPFDGPTVVELKKESDSLFALWFVEDFRVFGYAAEVAPAYDLFFHIQGPYLADRARLWGLGRAYYLPPAADPGLFRPQSQVPLKYRALVSLMGAGYPNRRAILANLITDYWLKSGRPPDGLKIFGSGWDGAPPAVAQRLFDGGRRVTAEECALIYAGTAINLNIHSAAGPGFDPRSAFVNPRTFELAASGAFQLVDPRPLMAGLFTEEEVAVVESPEELPEKIELYLGQPKTRKAMGEAARARALAEHQYLHRLSFIVGKAQSSGLPDVATGHRAETQEN